MELAPTEAEKARLFKIEMVEVSRTRVPEYRVEAAEDSTATIRLPRTGARITGRDDPAPEVEADKALACSRDNSYRKIRTKQLNPHCPEAEVGLRTPGKVGGKTESRFGDKIGRRTGTLNRNRNKSRMPTLRNHRLLKINLKNHRANNAEYLKQYYKRAALPI